MNALSQQELTDELHTLRVAPPDLSGFEERMALHLAQNAPAASAQVISLMPRLKSKMNIALAAAAMSVVAAGAMAGIFGDSLFSSSTDPIFKAEQEQFEPASRETHQDGLKFPTEPASAPSSQELPSKAMPPADEISRQENEARPNSAPRTHRVAPAAPTDSPHRPSSNLDETRTRFQVHAEPLERTKTVRPRPTRTRIHPESQ